MGNCKLCGLEKQLRKSHLLPKSAYKHLRDRPEEGGGSPLRVHMDSSEAFFTDIQVVKELLCDDCEQRFSRLGEQSVAKMWSTHKRFPLLERLQSVGNPIKGPRFSMYKVEDVGAQVLDDLFYFALSVIWRSNAWDWGRHTSDHKGSLGSYEPAVRNYLLGGDVPRAIRVIVTLDVNSETRALMKFPYVVKGAGCHLHRFCLLGLYFCVIIGGTPYEALVLPFERMNANVILMTQDMGESEDMMDLAVEFFERFPEGVER
ncbi:hypothetical protein [Pseudomonas putida]|uniref:hypothetical protein n=1 Tax=Pseudomonas putida TaxID=303 RepID=UPI002118D7FB|nr:hypothetical protein [Pseudomonas putida]